MFCSRTPTPVSYLLKYSNNSKPSFWYFLHRAHQYKINKLPRVPEQPYGYEERNEKLKRALSPHVTIYKFEMPSQQSIAHRATGIALSTYAIILGLGALFLPNDFQHYIDIIDGWHLNRFLLFLGKFLFALPFTIHFIGGVKHLIWDVFPAYTIARISNVFRFGYVVFGLGIVSALLLARIKTKRVVYFKR